MKRFLSVLCCMVILLSMSSCAENLKQGAYVPNRNFGIIESEFLSENGVMAFLEGTAIVQDEDNSIYLYDLKTEAIKKTGEISDFLISTHDRVFYDNKLYWVFCVGGSLNDFTANLYCLT